eukprot:GHVR01167158.1.p1 GENE.GHVR01167158.1~~GHVR01167158.1.p1  ORF type:complete len:175 (+),score=37.31 GHVR01167158.1:114-638(+)
MAELLRIEVDLLHIQVEFWRVVRDRRLCPVIVETGGVSLHELDWISLYKSLQYNNLQILLLVGGEGYGVPHWVKHKKISSVPNYHNNIYNNISSVSSSSASPHDVASVGPNEAITYELVKELERYLLEELPSVLRVVSVPMFGPIPSFNVSCAAAVVVSHLSNALIRYDIQASL